MCSRKWILRLWFTHTFSQIAFWDFHESHHSWWKWSVLERGRWYEGVPSTIVLLSRDIEPKSIPISLSNFQSNNLLRILSTEAVAKIPPWSPNTGSSQILSSTIYDFRISWISGTALIIRCCFSKAILIMEDYLKSWRIPCKQILRTFDYTAFTILNLSLVNCNACAQDVDEIS